MISTLEILLAKQEITEVIYLYCRAMDEIDRKLGLTIWHPDGTADYGVIFTGTGAEFIEWVSGVHETMTDTSHQVTNILIEIDGDTAKSECYVTAALRMQIDGVLSDQIVRGRYVDRWSRREQRWALDHRQYVPDFDHAYPVPNTVL
jgi:hypothetical protein